MPRLKMPVARKLFIAAALLTVWAVTASFYYGPAEPLSKAEIDRYMVGVRKLLETSFVVPEGVGIDPGGLEGALSGLRAFAERDDGRPIYMVNLMKWREGKPIFPEGAELAGSIKTVEEADLEYNRKLFWDLLKNDSHTAFLASAEPNAFNYGSSAELDGWGEIGIFRYKSRRDFFNMITSDSYRNILYLKLASMGVIALAPTQVHGLAFNPMPNFPVLLLGILTIAYLVHLLLAERSFRNRR